MHMQWKNRFERTLSRHVANQFPGVNDVGIQRLELHYAFVRALFEVGVGIETQLGRLDATRESRMRVNARKATL